MASSTGSEKLDRCKGTRMSTVILGDSRLRGLGKDKRFNDCVLHVRSGAKIQDHLSFVKQSKSESEKKLFIICLGINNVRDDIKGLSSSERKNHYNEIIRHFNSLLRTIKRQNRDNKVVIATIPPKELLRSVQKYPEKSDLEAKYITDKHQVEFEKFIVEINDEIADFNEKLTGHHLPLHSELRTHRGSGSTYKRNPKNKTSQFRYYKLYDGLHPNSELLNRWTEKIIALRLKLKF